MNKNENIKKINHSVIKMKSKLHLFEDIKNDVPEDDDTSYNDVNCIEIDSVGDISDYS